MLRDRDAKFSATFRDSGVEVLPVGPRAPNTNAHMERFLLSVQAECLDHFVILGPAHLCYLVESFLRHYHEDRPHQGLGNQTLAPRVATPSPRWEREDVVYHESLGALLKSDSWRAAA